MPYRIHGAVDSTGQISTIVTNSQFLVAADVRTQSGRLINPYQDGTKTELQVIQETLKGGTTNNRRLLANITGDRVMHVFEEPQPVPVEETTNLCANPSLEVDATGWGTDRTGPIWYETGVSRVFDYAYRGNYCAKLMYGTTGTWNIYYANGGSLLALNSANTVSIRARREDDAAVAGVMVLIDTGLAPVTPVITGPDADGWYTITATQVTGPSIVGLDRVEFDLPDGDDGVRWYFDACQIEAKARSTAYCDGSLGEGHSWNGTAHASTSHRQSAPAHILWMDEDGKFFWNEEPYLLSPVGWWIRTKNLPLSEIAVVNPGLFFCERATWQDGKWTVEARDTESPLLLG
jgi:hypothetical protein